jgi:photosystem II stability/assembly factor-like uncharacterized protein
VEAFAVGDGAFEVAVVEGVVFDFYGEGFVVGVEGAILAWPVGSAVFSKLRLDW